MTHRYGRQPRKTDARTLRYSSYSAQMPTAPASVDWSGSVAYPMLLNDELGDCVVAGALHAVQTWQDNADPANPVVFEDADALKLYEVWGGYVPGDSQTDQGCNMLDVLKAWKSGPAAVRPDDLAAYVSVDPQDVSDVHEAIWLFGGLYIGINVPAFLETPEFEAPGATWDVQSTNNQSVGGHCVLLVGYDENGLLDVISWGAHYKMTPAFLASYCDEAYALLSNDWINHQSNEAPSGFALAQLQADLKDLQGDAAPQQSVKLSWLARIITALEAELQKL